MEIKFVRLNDLLQPQDAKRPVRVRKASSRTPPGRLVCGGRLASVLVLPPYKGRTGQDADA
jgi:hypothetical protein